MKYSYINVMLLLLVSVFLLTGCNKPIEDKEAKAIVEEFLTTFKNCEYEKLYGLTDDIEAEFYRGIYTPEIKTNELMFNNFSKKLSYKINGVKKFDDNTIVVKTKLTNVNAEPLMERVKSQFVAYCQANEDIIDDIELDDLLYKVMEYEFSKDDIELVTKDTDFTLVNINGKWCVESGIIIYDDMTGGYITYYYKENIFNGIDIDKAKEKLKNLD